MCADDEDAVSLTDVERREVNDYIRKNCGTFDVYSAFGSSKSKERKIGLTVSKFGVRLFERGIFGKEKKTLGDFPFTPEFEV